MEGKIKKVQVYEYKKSTEAGGGGEWIVITISENWIFLKIVM